VFVEECGIYTVPGETSCLFVLRWVNISIVLGTTVVVSCESPSEPFTHSKCLTFTYKVDDFKSFRSLIALPIEG
jgi:hypothetical protein